MNDHGTHYYFRIMFLFPPEISLAVVHKVAHMITDHWRFMGHGLGLDDYTLEHINNMCSHPVDKALSTLNKWFEMNPEKARKDELIKCLTSIIRRDIADGIKDMDWLIYITYETHLGLSVVYILIIRWITTLMFNWHTEYRWPYISVGDQKQKKLFSIATYFVNILCCNVPIWDFLTNFQNDVINYKQ